MLKALMLATVLGMTPQIHSQGNYYVIENDQGGLVPFYITMFDTLHDKKIVIKGDCISACTLILRNHNICATENVRFGFHSAFEIDKKGNIIYNANDDIIVMALYPQKVQNFIQSQGGLTKDLKFYTSDQLGVPRCKKSY